MPETVRVLGAVSIVFGSSLLLFKVRSKLASITRFCSRLLGAVTLEGMKVLAAVRSGSKALLAGRLLGGGLELGRPMIGGAPWLEVFWLVVLWLAVLAVFGVRPIFSSSNRRNSVCGSDAGLFCVRACCKSRAKSSKPRASCVAGRGPLC